MDMKKIKVVVLSIMVLFIFSGCYYEYNNYSNYNYYRVKIKVDDSIYYENHSKYQALYAEFRGHKIYENDIFYVEEGIYRIKYTYQMDNILYTDNVKIEVFSDTEVKISGHEVRIYY